MRLSLKTVLPTLLLAILTGTALAQDVDTRATSAASAGTPAAIVAGFDTAWDIPPYDCASSLAESATLHAIKEGGACGGQTYSTTFSESSLTANGMTYMIACDTSTDRLTSNLGFCQTDCYCSGSGWDVACPADPPVDVTACHNATCIGNGTCGSNTPNKCGITDFNCETNADCLRCSDTGLLCTDDNDCNLGNCGPQPGTCSNNTGVACLPGSNTAKNSCIGTCDPADCGNRIMGFCDDDLDRACTDAADCGSCQNAEFEPCTVNADCNFGSCDLALTNIDNDFSFPNGISVTTGVAVPPVPPPIPMLDRTRTGLLVGGLLVIGIVLILRRLV